MSIQQNLIAGVCIAIGIASSGLAVKAGIDHFVDRDRVVTVKGLAERTVDADYVIWPVTFRVSGNDLTSLFNVHKPKVQKFVNTLSLKALKPKTSPWAHPM